MWFNTTHMHFRTHIKDGSRGKAGRWQSEYHDTMVDHDELVGSVLDFLDENGLAENTIVMYSTDNGPHMNTLARRRHDAVPQREELQLGGRLPGAGDGALARARSRPGTVLNGIVSHNDWFVTLLAAAGDTDVADRLKAGTELAGTTYKVHLDGHNQLDYITGAADKSPRKHFFYVSDDGDLTALRYDNWKFVFLEQRADRHAADLGRAVHRAARPEDLQPADRPVRAGRHHLEHLLRLGARPRLAVRPGAGVRRADAPDAAPSSRRARSRPASASTR